MDRSALKLGCLPQRVDPRTLRMAKYVNHDALPAIPKFRNWTTAARDWGMMLNDQLGCCTVSGAGHMIEEGCLWNKAPFALSNKQIEKAYADVSGWKGTEDTDNGAVMIDVLRYWRKTGIGGAKIQAYVQIDPSNTKMIRTAVELFGAAYCGVDMPNDSQNQIVWNVAGDGKSGDHAPGSWGGHCIPLFGFDSAAFCCVSWGDVTWMTEQWWLTYGTEAWAVITDDWVAANGKSPNGFDLQSLLNDQKLIAA
jgi:hypothetical protein